MAPSFIYAVRSVFRHTTLLSLAFLFRIRDFAFGGGKLAQQLFLLVAQTRRSDHRHGHVLVAAPRAAQVLNTFSAQTEYRARLCTFGD